jgi:sortase (surface protein transpeptidase)
LNGCVSSGTVPVTVRPLRRRPAAFLAFAVSAAAALLIPVSSRAAPSSWLALDGKVRLTPPAGVTFDWANSGAASPIPTCPAGAVNVTGTGGLFNCGTPGVGNAPPGAPALTPAALADASRISSTFIVDPLSSDTTACGASNDPTTFTTSVKNGDPINGITFGPGNVPNKNDLGNVYAVSHATAARPELFFGAERLSDNGDSHIDFEFLQTIVGLTAGCSGTFSGHRTEGDLLVAVDFTGGGGTATNALYQWHCNAEPGPQPADGTVCDPGGTAHYQQITVPGSISFTVNAAIVACGGWICRDTGGVTAQLAPNDFLEGGLDLTVLNFTGCFHTFLPHTRTAQSFSAALTDFAGPSPLATCRTPAITTASNPTGFDQTPGVVASDHVSVQGPAGSGTPQGTVGFFLCGPGQVTAGGCPTGNPVGADKALVAGAATSDPTAATTPLGTYCWRVVYTPAGSSVGIFDTAGHTDAGPECFAVGVPGPPAAGRGLDLPMPPPDFVPAPAMRDDAPVRISIPSLGVDAAVENLGLLPNGQMAVPQAVSDAGWLASGPAPGSVGNAVIAGHLDGVSGQPAAFWGLGRLRPGDTITVATAGGTQLRFVVVRIARYDRQAVPLVAVFGPSKQANLNLLTCAGRYLPNQRTYRDRLVVYTRLVDLSHDAPAALRDDRAGQTRQTML